MDVHREGRTGNLARSDTQVHRPIPDPPVPGPIRVAGHVDRRSDHPILIEGDPRAAQNEYSTLWLSSAARFHGSPMLAPPQGNAHHSCSSDFAHHDPLSIQCTFQMQLPSITSFSVTGFASLYSTCGKALRSAMHSLDCLRPKPAHLVPERIESPPPEARCCPFGQPTPSFGGLACAHLKLGYRYACELFFPRKAAYASTISLKSVP